MISQKPACRNISFVQKKSGHKKGGVFVAAVGVIAEFNPFHNGHKFLVDYAKKNGDTVICTISSNFVQRGDTAVLSKKKRAMAALLCSVDVVAEMPVLWSMSTAQNFALCGVWQLYNLGCESIVFGSESGDIDALKNAAEVICGDEFFARVSQFLKDGVTFAKAREQAAVSLGVAQGLLSNPNDNLGIEYIIAAKKLKLPIDFCCVKRAGISHDAVIPENGYANGSLMRKWLIAENFRPAYEFMPAELKGLFDENDISDIRKLETAIMCSLRMKTAEELKNLPDVSEGIENRLYSSIRLARNLDELYNMIKSKRYTLARIRRLVLSAFLGFDKEFFMATPPYTRVLGFSPKGEEHLKNLKAISPVVTSVSQIRLLKKDALKVFETECRATDIYALTLGKPLECSAEFKMKILKTECLK